MKNHQQVNTRETGSVGADTDLHKSQNEMLAYLEDLDRVRDSQHIRDDLIDQTNEIDKQKELGADSPGRRNIERTNIDMFSMNKEVKTITKGSKLLNVVQANRTTGTLNGQDSSQNVLISKYSNEPSSKGNSKSKHR